VVPTFLLDLEEGFEGKRLDRTEAFKRTGPAP